MTKRKAATTKGKTTTEEPLNIEVIGAQVYFVEVGCYKHVRAAIMQIEAAAMTVLNVVPLIDYDMGGDKVLMLRAALIFVAGDARPVKGEIPG